jgi:uncharacterized protein YdiU (UPF0061 family)
MTGSVIAEKLGVTRQRVRQLIVRLHALGWIAFGDRDDPFWIVMRAEDKSLILSYDEERVLSALPRERAADAAADERADAKVRALFANPAAYDSWVARWRSRLVAERLEPDARAQAMRTFNPGLHPAQSSCGASARRSD